MPKQVPEAKLDTIVEAVARLSNGGSVEAIHGTLGLGVARRTLQRRLATLVARGRLVRTGRGPGTRYRVPTGEADASPSLRSSGTRDTAPAEYNIPLSSEGAAVSRAVRAPVQERPTVGYRREFLDDYRPGVTWYLPAVVRERLLALGNSPDREHPAGTFARKIHERLLIDLSCVVSRFLSWNPPLIWPDCSVGGLPGMTEQSGHLAVAMEVSVTAVV